MGSSDGSSIKLHWFEHAYAYSGVITDAGTGGPNTTMLSFATGPSYFVGKISFTDDSVANDNAFFQVEINGEVIMAIDYKTGSSAFDGPQFPFPILIPAYSNVVVKFGSTSSDEGTAWLGVGRVYKLMPKKKLTKTQVKRKLKQASTIMYDLFLDKLRTIKKRCAYVTS